jgi:DNA-directed RNA polymerase subunit M/transcription elongation factor TFIIS
LVILCPRCGSVRYSKGGQKTAACFKCGHRIKLDPMKVRIIFKTDKRREAIEAVKKYKMKLAERDPKRPS